MRGQCAKLLSRGILLGFKILGLDRSRLIRRWLLLHHLGYRRLHTLDPLRTYLSSCNHAFLLHYPFPSIRTQSIRYVFLGQGRRARCATRLNGREQRGNAASFGTDGEACMRVLVFEMATTHVWGLFANGSVENLGLAVFFIGLGLGLLISSDSGCFGGVLILHREQLRSDGKIDFISLWGSIQCILFRSNFLNFLLFAMVSFLVILQHILVKFAWVELVLKVCSGRYKEGLVRWQIHAA